MTHKKCILISGATGQQGGAIARELLKDDRFHIHAMTRHPDSEAAKALEAQGAKLIQADLDDEASLRTALKGAWGALAVQNTWTAGVEGEEEQGHRFARVAKDAGVQHFVYQSVASADRQTGIPHFENKFRIEDTVRSLGFDSYAIVRPVFFMENLLGPWFKPYIGQGNLAIGIKPETKLQSIAVADIGKYGALALSDVERFKNAELDIAGDELTGPEMAAVLSRVTGKPINFYQVPIEQVRAGSDDFATMLEWFDAVGYDVDIDANAREYGIRPTKFEEWARQQSW